MRNRKQETIQKLDIFIDLITELTDRASKTNSNVKFEAYIKCAELIQQYASGMVSELLNESED